MAFGDNRSFRIFDATAYSKKPDLSVYGIEKITIVYVAQLFPQWPNISADELPGSDIIKRVVDHNVNRRMPIVIDIEHWPLRGNPTVVHNSVNKYIHVLDEFHRLSPGIRVGLYGVLPIIEYFQTLRPTTSREYKQWQSENLQLHEISDHIDYVFPSLYTFNYDQDKWSRYATAQLKEARKIGKPIYAFVWPQIHDSNRLYGKSYIGYKFWRRQLDIIYHYADGVVIWGGHKPNGGSDIWNEKAKWWLATKDFIVWKNNQY